MLMIFLLISLLMNICKNDGFYKVVDIFMLVIFVLVSLLMNISKNDGFYKVVDIFSC
jgi:hypothetical protein